MTINSNYYPWNENNVNKISASPGVYAFFDKSKILIYIGSSNNLRERFQGYWNSQFTQDPCKKDTVRYKREFTDNYKQRERELLQEYREKNNKLPKCNDYIP